MFNRHVIDQLSSYLDDQLKRKQRLAIDTHLKGCTSCSKELARLRLLSERLKAWQPPELSGDFDASVKDKILRWEIQGGNVKMKSKSLAFVIPSSALALLLMVAFLATSSVKRGIQGRMKSTVDDVGEQFSAGVSGDYYRIGEEISLGGRYEPHYLARDKAGVPSYRGSEKVMKGAYTSNVSGAGQSYAANTTVMGWGEFEALPEAKPESSTLSSIPGEGSVIVINPVLPATSEGEKVIRKGEITLEVENGKEAYKKVAQVCQELGGYLAQSKFSKDNEGRESGTLTLRIPKDKFLAALDQLSALGKVTAMNSNSQDVGQEYKNLKQELDISMVVYNKMLDALHKKQVTIPEAMRMESELTPVLRRIESLKEKLQYLDNQVSFTTITLAFYEPRISAKVLSESKLLIKQTIIESAIKSVRFIASSLPATLLFVVLVALCIGWAIIIKRFISYLFKRK